MRDGFTKRIIYEKNQDLFSHADNSAEDRVNLEHKVLKNLGPRLQGVVL